MLQPALNLLSDISALFLLYPHLKLNIHFSLCQFLNICHMVHFSFTELTIISMQQSSYAASKQQQINPTAYFSMTATAGIWLPCHYLPPFSIDVTAMMMNQTKAFSTKFIDKSIGSTAGYYPTFGSANL